MWKIDKPRPFEFNKSTIFSSEKNLKNHGITHQFKRNKTNIVDNTSFMFYFDKVDIFILMKNRINMIGVW